MIVWLDMYSKHCNQLSLNIWLSHQMTTKIQKSVLFVSRFLISSHINKASNRPGVIDLIEIVIDFFRYFVLTAGNKNPGIR